MNFAWMDEAVHAHSGAFERAMRVLPSAEIDARPAYDRAKRLFDLVLGALAAAVAALPMLAKKVGFDPTVMASPLITTVVDATSLLTYFWLASWMLGI